MSKELATELDCIDKLGQIEDILEKYGIETIEDLNVIFAEYFCEVKEHILNVNNYVWLYL